MSAWRNFRDAVDNNKWLRRGLVAALIVLLIVFPLFFQTADAKVDVATTSLAYVVMALGLNIVVGFAGLLDLGYVAFYALGALTVGWLGSSFVYSAKFHVGVSGPLNNLQGIHLNWLLIFLAAMVVCAIAGMLIGLPTLRLRGDYIAIVTLAFGEIIYRFALNGDDIKFGSQALTAGSQGITPVDPVNFGIGQPFNQLNLRPWYWTTLVMAVIVLLVNFRLRDSRLGRAWIAIREDEVAAASMGIPLVKTKLMAYATGAAFGGMSGAFLAAYTNTVNADQFQFAFSIFILSMIILGGLGSIWGVALGAVILQLVNRYLIPDVLNDKAQSWFHFDLTQLSFSIFGFILVLVMLIRPEGLLPERRRKLELREGIGAGATEESLVEVHA